MLCYVLRQVEIVSMRATELCFVIPNLRSPLSALGAVLYGWDACPLVVVAFRVWQENGGVPQLHVAEQGRLQGEDGESLLRFEATTKPTISTDDLKTSTLT